MTDLLATVVSGDQSYSAEDSRPLTQDTAGKLRTSDPTVAGLLGVGPPRCVATFNRPADATQYSVGDLIANSGTAASVVPIEFTVPFTSGRVTGCRCVITPASGSLVIAACDFDLILFRPEASIPFADAGYPADNAALVITGLAQEEQIGVLQFTNANWRSGAGSTTVAGASGYQRGAIMSSAPFFPFNISTAASTTKIRGVLQAQGVWNPGAVVNRFAFALDVTPY